MKRPALTFRNVYVPTALGGAVYRVCLYGRAPHLSARLMIVERKAGRRVTQLDPGSPKARCMEATARAMILMERWR